MALSVKHQQFVEAYLQGATATDAYLVVYPTVNRTTAATNGWRLLRTTRIAEAIQARLNHAAMPADEVLARITDHARADVDDFLDADGAFDLVKARRAKRTGLIKKFKTKTATRMVGEMEVKTIEVEFELHDAQTALGMLGKHYKLFADRTELTGKDGGPIETADATLTDEQRASRIAAILDAARTRRDRQPTEDGPSDLAPAAGTTDRSLLF